MAELAELKPVAPATRTRIRDRREGGQWTQRQRLKNWVLYHAIRFALGLADRLHERWLLALGRLVGRAVHHAAPRLRKRVVARARRVLGARATPAFARDVFMRAGENLALCLWLRRPSASASRFVTVSAAARCEFRSAMERGTGVVVVSAHLGPFELLAARVAELGLAPAVVVRESYDPRLDPVVDAHRVKQGVLVIHRGRPGASARVLRALRRGHPVGFLIDLPGRVRSTSLPFLGTPRMLPVGPQRLSQLTGARLLVATLQRRSAERGSLPHFDLRVTSVEQGTSDHGSMVALTRRVSHQLERDIMDTPEDWLWMAE